MKNLLMIAAAAAALAATPAFAGSPVSSSVTLNATVDATCSLVNNGASTLTVENLAGSDGKINLNALNNPVVQFHGFCNGSSSILEVAVTPLVSNQPAAQGWTNKVSYAALAYPQAHPNQYTGVNSGWEGGQRAVGGYGLMNENIDVVLTGADAEDRSAPLLAGSYTGSVTLTLTPAA